MKVLILVNHDVVIYNFRLELVEKLLQQENEVYISSPYGERIEPLKELGCHYIETKLSRHSTSIKQDFLLIRFYIQLIQKIKPDVVLTYTIKPNVYGGIACQFTKTSYVSNVTGLGTAVENGGLMSFITTNLYKIGIRHCDCIFFQNQENLSFFEQKKMGGKKKRLIPGSGVNLDKFNFVPYPKEDTIEFVFIARIMKEKGIEQYLDMAEYIGEKYPETRFHICGFCEEDYEERLNQLHQNNKIHYHGMVKNIKEVLENIHCTIHPTYYPEGLSNVLLESCATGRPIITTDRSGCREVVEDGVNGFVVEQKNSQDLIEKVELFLSLTQETREEMGRNAREKVEREFSRNIVIDAYIEEIDRCCR